jgi:adenine-specific DNA glycosylase
MTGRWQDRAACLTAGPDFVNWTATYQKPYCRVCPVTAECLMYALKYESGQYYEAENPVYGGLTGKERRALLRPKKAAA